MQARTSRWRLKLQTQAPCLCRAPSLNPTAGLRHAWTQGPFATLYYTAPAPFPTIPFPTYSRTLPHTPPPALPLPLELVSGGYVRTWYELVKAVQKAENWMQILHAGFLQRAVRGQAAPLVGPCTCTPTCLAHHSLFAGAPWCIHFHLFAVPL